MSSVIIKDPDSLVSSFVDVNMGPVETVKGSNPLLLLKDNELYFAKEGG